MQVIVEELQNLHILNSFDSFEVLSELLDFEALRKSLQVALIQAVKDQQGSHEENQGLGRQRKPLEGMQVEIEPDSSNGMSPGQSSEHFEH